MGGQRVSDKSYEVNEVPKTIAKSDPRDNDIGRDNRENVQRLLGSLAIYPFTEILGTPIQDVLLLIAQARLEADNPAFKV